MEKVTLFEASAESRNTATTWVTVSFLARL